MRQVTHSCTSFSKPFHGDLSLGRWLSRGFTRRVLALQGLSFSPLFLSWQGNSWPAGGVWAAMSRPQERLRLPPGLLGIALLLAGCWCAQAAPAQAPRGVSRAAAHEASNEAAPPAGFEYQPSDPAFYRAVAQQARERFRVNGSFFHDINSTVVPKILGVTNGTFDVLPLNINATPRAEADDDGAYLPCCKALAALLWAQDR